MIWFLFVILGFYIKKICVKNQIDIFDRKNVLANFLNGPISKNSFLISKIFNNKVMVIIFILIGIYHLYLNMSLIKHNKIHNPFFCKFFKKSFFSKSSILNVDKNRKHFNPHFKYEDFKKIVENLIWTRFVQINHKGLIKVFNTRRYKHLSYQLFKLLHKQINCE